MFSKRRFVLPLLVLFCLLAACQQGAADPTHTPGNIITLPVATATNTRQADTHTTTPTVTSAATIAPAPTATEGPLVERIKTIEVDELALSADGVVLYPVPVIYDGDVVTFQILPDVPPQLRPDEIAVQILIDGEFLVEDSLRYRNLAGQSVGLYEWVWDTTGLAGLHELRVVLDPEDWIQDGDAEEADNVVVMDIMVNPTRDLPASERDARWLTRETDQAIIHVVTGTAAHRDLDFIAGIVDAAVQQASQVLGEAPAEKLHLYLIERVIGQGGYAGGVMVISYLDRDYAGDGFYEVLVHESVHLIDRQFSQNRIPFLGEGVAVWATGGHYKQEDLDRRAAALVSSELYVPLPELIDDFYPIQHEIGYLTAAGFTKYLIDQYGWVQYKRFYSEFEVESGETQTMAVDRSFRAFFGKSLATLEAEWLAYLSTVAISAADVDDLLTTVRYYNVMRRYQTTFDPTAYYLEAWLPSPVDAEMRGLTADFVRHPQSEFNIALEAMLAATDSALRVQDFRATAVLLDSVEHVLNSGTFADPLSRAYLQLVERATDFGYEVQEIALNGTTATVVVTPTGTTNLLLLRFDLNEGVWVLST